MHSRLRVRSANGLLDPLADLLAPVAGPLLSTLVPALKGLPIVGGLVDVVAGIVGGVGGAKIGSLLTGKPTMSAAFVASNDAQSPIEQFAFQIDASSDTASPLFLAQLPFALPTSGCHSPNATKRATPGPVPVAIVLPILANSSLQVMCATYNSTPSSPSMLIAQPCWNSTKPDGSRAEEPANLSQVFAWSQDTGAVQPLWNGTAPTRMSCPPSDGVVVPTSTVVAGNANIVDGSSAPQSVTLVFSADPTVGNSTTPTDNNSTSTVS